MCRQFRRVVIGCEDCKKWRISIRLLLVKCPLVKLVCFSIRFFCFVDISQLKGKVVVGNHSLYYDFVYQYTVIFREKKKTEKGQQILYLNFAFRAVIEKKKVD